MHATIARLTDVMNRHDASEMASLFSPLYECRQAAHPNRGFSGADQVEANWTRMFAAVPDMRVECIAATVDGATAWTEWHWAGSHPDGVPFAMAGVIIFGLADDGRFTSARLYMEPVEQDGPAIDEAVRRFVDHE